MPVAHDSIPTEGIVGMELEDLRQADRFGYVAKLLGIAIRAPAGLDLRVHPAFIPKRYLLASVRDYHQAKIANDQNEVMKRLTVVASVLLLPTFIVGLYGQNFRHIPETSWSQGYAFVWALIVVTTALQLWYFRKKHWI